MIYTYHIYKYVKMINKENTRLTESALLKILEGKQDTADKFQLIEELEAIKEYAGSRFIFKRVGLVKASQVSKGALKYKYIEPTNMKTEEKHFRVTHIKGLNLIDGIPFIRPGLWKAWHTQHGWLIPVLIGAFGLGLGGGLRQLWEIIFH